MPVKPIPEGLYSVTPYLMVEKAPRLLQFVKAAFDAKAIERITTPDGCITHAKVRIGDSVVMIAEAQGDGGPIPGSLYLYVTATDATYHRALEAGATPLMEPENRFFGDRIGGVMDTAGNLWWIATHIEDISYQKRQKLTNASS